MSADLAKDQQSVYDRDYLIWVETMAIQLEEQDYTNLGEITNIGEIQGKGWSKRKNLETCLGTVLLYLLKWQYQPESRDENWKIHITRHRQQMNQGLTQFPSFMGYLDERMTACYGEVVKQVIVDTQLPGSTFPTLCPYTLSEILDGEFFPR